MLARHSGSLVVQIGRGAACVAADSLDAPTPFAVLEGQTWELLVESILPAAGTPPTQWLIENIIAPYQNKDDVGSNRSGLLQTFRSNSTTFWQSSSEDDGNSWTPASPGALPAPNSKAGTP